jgi:hypothetical protein
MSWSAMMGNAISTKIAGQTIIMVVKLANPALILINITSTTSSLKENILRMLLLAMKATLVSTTPIETESIALAVILSLIETMMMTMTIFWLINPAPDKSA